MDRKALRKMWSSVVTPVTVLTVAIVVALYAVGEWEITAINLATHIWPGRIVVMDPEPLAPLWAVCLTLLSLSLLRYRRRLRRARLGLCLRCGYDLRESKERCPECGAVIRRGP